MFKNKEIRDNVLLISMALITIAFLIYIFFPSGEKEPPKEDKKGKQAQVQRKTQKKPIRLLPVTEQDTDEKIVAELHHKIEKELADLYLAILASANPFEDYQADALKRVVAESENEILKKYAKFSFFDLNAIANIEFPPVYTGALKFNIFLSMFLIKIPEEGVVQRFSDLTATEFEKEIDAAVYDLINREIERDYQVIPLLFYFKLLVQRLNIYPQKDNAAFFLQKIENIMDLSFSKHLQTIKELLSFSADSERFRIEWLEHDGIGADDKGTYTGLNLKTFRFFKQDYLVFPDPGNEQANTWLKELGEADSGDIELRELRIQSEDPARNSRIEKLLYTPINSQFIVVLDEYRGSSENLFIHRLVLNKLRDFHKNFNVITFSEDALKDESFQKALEQFGDYLKKNIIPALDSN